MKKLTFILVLLILLTGCTKSLTNISSSNTVTIPIAIDSNVSYYFARQTPNVDQQLIKVIDSSKSTLDIAIYSLTKKSIVNAIINAKNRGINVEVITDKIKSGQRKY